MHEDQCWMNDDDEEEEEETKNWNCVQSVKTRRRNKKKKDLSFDPGFD